MKVAEVAFKLVAARFVEVVFVPVASVQIMPPMVAVAAERPFKTDTEEAFRYWPLIVPVAFKFDVVTPPKKVTATEVVAPRAVTEARVSASAG